MDGEKTGEPRILVSTVSWEPRFQLGFLRLLEKQRPTHVQILQYVEWQRWSATALEAVRKQCQEREIHLDVLELSLEDPLSTWHRFRLAIERTEWRGASALVDITTMPREALWTVFRFLQRTEARISYAYHRPDQYGDWLSRDPQRPRFVLQLSGVSRFGLPTALVISTGFDPERTDQLRRSYEPRTTLLAIQKGSQFQNRVRNEVPHHQLEREGPAAVQGFEIDAFSPDHGFDVLRSNVLPLREGHNIILASLGPKLAAVAMYRLLGEVPDAALAYTPSKEYNRSYSDGIADTVFGDLASGQSQPASGSS